jgi:hypothetical protein
MLAQDSRKDLDWGGKRSEPDDFAAQHRFMEMVRDRMMSVIPFFCGVSCTFQDWRMRSGLAPVLVSP